MPSFKSIFTAATVGLAAFATALPAGEYSTLRARAAVNELAAAAGISDVDILQL
jgi:hypothetical protein